LAGTVAGVHALLGVGGPGCLLSLAALFRNTSLDLHVVGHLTRPGTCRCRRWSFLAFGGSQLLSGLLLLLFGMASELAHFHSAHFVQTLPERNAHFAVWLNFGILICKLGGWLTWNVFEENAFRELAAELLGLEDEAAAAATARDSSSLAKEEAEDEFERVIVSEENDEKEEEMEEEDDEIEELEKEEEEEEDCWSESADSA
jgi:hypothetical protein